jgi:hypothetical protein
VDFDLDEGQSDRIELLRRMAAAASPTVGSADGWHPAFVAALLALPELVGPDLSLLDRVLLVEEAARLGVAMSASTVLLLVPLCGLDDRAGSSGPVAVTAGDDGPVRCGADADTVIAIDGRVVRVGRVTPLDREAVASGFRSTLGIVTGSSWRDVTWPLAVPPRAVHRLGLAAEIAGAGQAAIDHTARYLTSRTAFGQPLAGLQALRHRIAERAVDVAGTAALVHWAAWRGDDASMAAAVASACATAAALVPELHQLCGARGFVTDFGLARFTMPVEALRIELGGVYRTAAEHAETRWKEVVP